MKRFLSIALVLFLGIPVFAQEEDEGKLPVRAPFETSILIDNHTVVSPPKGALEFQIHHRFGTVKNGITDIFGIYAPSNIRLGFLYGITDKIMVGLGTTKDYKLQDFQAKYAIIQQTRNGKIPVSLSYYGNMVIDARDKKDDPFGPKAEFKEMHRLSYYSQLLVARKFGEKFAFQLAPGFIYYNALQTGLKNANFTIHAGGRAQVIGFNSIIVEYNQLLTQQPDSSMQPKPGLSAGVELGTSTHCFQIFISNTSQIIGQRNLLYNTNDFTKGELHFGFNITVRF